MSQSKFEKRKNWRKKKLLLQVVAVSGMSPVELQLNKILRNQSGVHKHTEVWLYDDHKLHVLVITKKTVYSELNIQTIQKQNNQILSWYLFYFKVKSVLSLLHFNLHIDNSCFISNITQVSFSRHHKAAAHTHNQNVLCAQLITTQSYFISPYHTTNHWFQRCHWRSYQPFCLKEVKPNSILWYKSLIRQQYKEPRAKVTSNYSDVKNNEKKEQKTDEWVT